MARFSLPVMLGSAGVPIPQGAGEAQGLADWFAKDGLYSSVAVLDRVGYGLTDRFRGDRIQAIVGIGRHGSTLALAVGRPLGLGVILINGEETESGFELTNIGKEILERNKLRTLIVKDVATNSAAIVKIVEALNMAGAQVVCVGVVAHRGRIEVPEGIKFESLHQLG